MGTRIGRFSDLTGQVSTEVTEVIGMLGEDGDFKIDLAPAGLTAAQRTPDYRKDR